MKILYCHQHFTVPTGAGGSRSYEFARHLIERGHQVTMLCGLMRGSGVEARLPAGGAVRRGMIDGIEVVAYALPYSNHDSLLKRSMTFARFSCAAVWQALAADYDLIFATSTPLTAALPGLAAKWLRGKPFVFEVRDLWPELPKAMGVIRNPVILAGLAVLERAAYASADACVGLSPGMVEGIRRVGPPGLPVAMIPNGCDLDIFVPGRRADFDLPGISPSDTAALFTGAHGLANGLESVLDTAAVLLRRGRLDIKLVFIGDGGRKAALQEQATARGLSNCLFFDPVPKVRLGKLLGSADLGLMVLRNVPAFYYGTSPNKFFDYLSAGLPVVTNYPGWVADLISQHECGRAVPPDDPEAFAQALIDMADHPAERVSMRERARRLAESEFARPRLCAHFADWIERAWLTAGS